MLDVQPEASRLYGLLDGDRITSVIEKYLIRGEIEKVSRFSKQLTSTLEEIKQKVIEQGGKVEYCAGDNILFSGKFRVSWCEGLLKLFYAQTGCTASIGIGDTSAEFYLALKLAKSEGGGRIIDYRQPFTVIDKNIESEQRPDLTPIGTPAAD